MFVSERFESSADTALTSVNAPVLEIVAPDVPSYTRVDGTWSVPPMVRVRAVTFAVAVALLGNV